MKFTRRAKAQWQGGGKDGSGTLSTDSGVLNNTAYSFHTRFEDGIGTNPEELIGAAHAGCFTMQLSFLLGEEGFTPESLETGAKVIFEDTSVAEIELKLNAKVPGIDSATLDKIAKKAKDVCPISKLLKAKITLKTTLSS